MARILLVEDEPDILKLVRMQLQLAGHEVAAAASAPEALDLLQQERAPDLVILDVSMPRMNGLTLLRELRSREGMQDLPAIFLSARVQRSEVEAGQALGATYLTKPYLISTLLDAVDRALADRAR